MAKRVSHSLLDPFFTAPIKSLYRILPIPVGFPPEGIIGVGHLFAILGALGFSSCVSHWWGGLLIAIGVSGNHLADCIDGTHARATGQCRNGGELLDHFVDPLSFSYWLCGWSVALQRLDLGLVAVILLYATSVLTNIQAKMIGEFTLARFGPTEFKTLLVMFGLTMSGLTWEAPTPLAHGLAFWFFVIMIGVGGIQLLVNLVKAVRKVNTGGPPPDTTEWIGTDE